MACSTPVAFIIYNRPDLTQQVFAAIRRARPLRLLVIADGPRTSADTAKCQAARAVVQAVDWPCEVRTHFSEKNLGCGRRPATGIDWVFSQVEEAIILEDDCLPAPSFFHFCECLLKRYRQDLRIMHISGDNYQLGQPRTEAAYYFSKYTHSCGWATWRRAWKFYDYELKSWEAFKAAGLLRAICPDPVEAAHWDRKLTPIARQERDDAWDYQWTYAVWTQGGLSILPAVNLISNLGFRSDATHTRVPSRWGNLPVGEIEELVDPPFVVQNREADRFTFDEMMGGRHQRERHTWSYRLAKPVRLYHKLQAKVLGATPRVPQPLPGPVPVFPAGNSFSRANPLSR